ncbi:MAG: metallophosphoesterase [Balneolaceae bacterium]|nr:metallophosphoesterase [Balneolaceae bacterium]
MPWLLRMTLVVSGLMAVSHFYLGWRLTKAVSYNFKESLLKWFPALLLVSFYMLPLTGLSTFWVYGHVDMMQVPKWITYWFWFGLVFSYQLLTWVILFDVAKIIAGKFGRWREQKINTFHFRALLIAGLLVFIFSGVKLYLNTTQVQVDEIDLAIKDLPESLDGLKIVHITDIQGDRYTGAEEIVNYVNRVNELDVDLIIFTGDLISYGTDYIEMAAREFSKVKSTYGTFAVVGDHDFWAGLEHVEPALEDRGIPLLRDENEIISIKQDSLLLTGITQVYSKRANPQEVDSLTKVNPGLSFKILASHQTSDILIDEAQENDYRLFLTGHTHGGQIRVPFMFMAFSASDMETEYVNGPYWLEDLLINVNNGLGFTLGPVRYNAPPNISVINLKAK